MNSRNCHKNLCWPCGGSIADEERFATGQGQNPFRLSGPTLILRVRIEILVHRDAPTIQVDGLSASRTLIRPTVSDPAFVAMRRLWSPIKRSPPFFEVRSGSAPR